MENTGKFKKKSDFKNIKTNVGNLFSKHFGKNVTNVVGKSIPNQSIISAANSPNISVKGIDIANSPNISVKGTDVANKSVVSSAKQTKAPDIRPQLRKLGIEPKPLNLSKEINPTNSVKSTKLKLSETP